MTNEHQNANILLRRADASKYLKETWGIDFATGTLAKIACTSSDGPPFHKAGRWPLYPKTGLDEFALRRLGPLRRSTSDRPRTSDTQANEAA